MRISLLAFLVPTALTGQTLVSTSPQNRTGILEEFTAINCGNCPQGHAVAANLLAANPGDLIVVGVHGGGLSAPSGSQPDFRTDPGNTLWSYFGVAAQPLGMMNRTLFNTQLVLSRTNWPGALATNLALPSPVNIGASTQFEPDTRELTVNVEAYYTANGAGANDRLHVLLTESDIIGYQQDYQNGAHADYAHQHVLRSYISPLWGDELTDNSQGTLEQRTYTINVPMGWDIANCHVVAFVGEYQGEIHNAVELAANNAATGVRNEANTTDLLVYPQPATDRLYITSNATAPVLYAISDLNGRVIVTAGGTNTGSAIGIDVSALSNGIYVLRLQDRAQRFVVAR